MNSIFLFVKTAAAACCWFFFFVTVSSSSSVVVVAADTTTTTSSSSSSWDQREKDIADTLGLTKGVEEQLKIICQELVNQGSCGTYPQIMMEYCRESCIAWQQRVSKVDVEKDDDRSFFTLSAKNQEGKLLDFDRFEGYLTLVLNLGLTCLGDNDMTDKKKNPQVVAIQQGLDEFDKLLGVWPHGLEIVIFPFKALPPGVKEEEDDDDDDCDLADIQEIVGTLSTKKVNLMETIQMNGKETHPVYHYFKTLFKKDTMETNLATYFFINPDGNQIFKHYAASLDQIKTYLRELLERDL